MSLFDVAQDKVLLLALWVFVSLLGLGFAFLLAHAARVNAFLWGGLGHSVLVIEALLMTVTGSKGWQTYLLLLVPNLIFAFVHFKCGSEMHERNDATGR